MQKRHRMLRYLQVKLYFFSGHLCRILQLSQDFENKVRVAKQGWGSLICRRMLMHNTNSKYTPSSSTRCQSLPKFKMTNRSLFLCRSSLLIGQARRLFSTTSQEQKIYELRTYSVQPARFVEFLKLTEQHVHLRTARSKLIGYWSTELGGLNEVVHIWEYGVKKNIKCLYSEHFIHIFSIDSFKHRADVRKMLANDKEWLETYVSKAFPMLRSQVRDHLLRYI